MEHGSSPSPGPAMVLPAGRGRARPRHSQRHSRRSGQDLGRLTWREESITKTWGADPLALEGTACRCHSIRVRNDRAGSEDGAQPVASGAGSAKSGANSTEAAAECKQLLSRAVGLLVVG